MCGIIAFGAQWCGYIFILYYTHLKLALLLHKTVLLTFLLASTVEQSFLSLGMNQLKYHSSDKLLWIMALFKSLKSLWLTKAIKEITYTHCVLWAKVSKGKTESHKLSMPTSKVDSALVSQINSAGS